MKIYTIYKAKNLINEKCYIGFDSCWPKRKNKHLYCNTNYIFHNAIQKYGKDAFVWEILYQSKERDHTLKVMEEFFIKENNSHYLNGHGYNMTYGGNGTFGYIHSLETKEKIGNSWKGKKHSEETKKKLSENMIGQEAWNKGIPNIHAQGAKWYNNGEICRFSKEPLDFPWVLGRLKFQAGKTLLA